MKNLIYSILAALLLMGSLPATAQVSDEGRTVGGFGHFFIGPGFVQSKKINDYLKHSDVLGASYSPSPMGYIVGGEGGAVLNRFIIGGGGFGIVTASTSSDSARAMTSLGGGYFKLGYKFYETPKTFMYGYVSFGGSGYALQLSNIADSTPINFNHKYPIAAGKKENYAFGGFLFDFGVSLKTFAISKAAENDRKKGGLMIGVDLGCNITLPISDWETSNNNNNGNNNDNKIVVTGPPTPVPMLSPYLRITIGGGGIVTKKY